MIAFADFVEAMEYEAAFVSCTDCPGYAWDLAEQMNGVQTWKFQRFAPVYGDNGINVRTHGIVVGMTDPSHPTDAAKALAAAFKYAGIEYSFGQLNTEPEVHYGGTDAPIDTVIVVMPR